MVPDAAGAEESRRWSCGISREGVNYIVVGFGLDRLLAEIDRRHCFAGDSLIGEILNYVSAEGLGPVMRRLKVRGSSDGMFDNAQRFRQRYVLAALGTVGF